MDRCPNCLRLRTGERCPECGYRPDAYAPIYGALPRGTLLAGRFRLYNALDHSRQALVYAAWDEKEERAALVTELFPDGIAARDAEDDAVSPMFNSPQFRIGVNRYQESEQAMPLPLLAAFSANGTACRAYAAEAGKALRGQAETLADRPILFRDGRGLPVMTVTCRTIDPLPAQRDYAPVRRDLKKPLRLLAALGGTLAVLAALLLLKRSIPSHAHTPVTVRENEIPATCAASGEYDEVTRCAECGEELSRIGRTLPVLAHTPGQPVRENETPAACTHPGSYDEVLYCAVGGEELRRERKEIPQTPHTPGRVRYTLARRSDCARAGAVDKTEICAACGAELSAGRIVLPLRAHTPGEPVRENETPPAHDREGSYDRVTYCAVCGERLARVHVVVARLPDAAEETAAPSARP